MENSALGGLFSVVTETECVAKEGNKTPVLAENKPNIEEHIPGSPEPIRMTFEEIIRFGVVRGMKYLLHVDYQEIADKTGEDIGDVIEWCRNDTGKTNEK